MNYKRIKILLHHIELDEVLITVMDNCRALSLELKTHKSKMLHDLLLEQLLGFNKRVTKKLISLLKLFLMTASLTSLVYTH